MTHRIPLVRSFLIAFPLVLLPYAILLYSLPIGDDSGVFMYTGLIISEGGLPYVDSWDHKGPLLYLFNAAAFYLFQSARGVIALEGLALFVALVFSIRLWSRFLPEIQVFLVATLFAATFYATFEGGNLTESWLVPFLLITYSKAFAVVSDLRENEMTGNVILMSILLGVSLAVALLTRPNNGLGLIILTLGLLYICKGKRYQMIFLISICFALVVISTVAWLIHAQAFAAFFEQYILFNLAYSSDSSVVDRIRSAHTLITTLLFSPLGLVTLAIGFVSMMETKSGISLSSAFAPKLFTTVFFIDISSQLVSGQDYLHYISLATASMAVVLVSHLSQLDIRLVRRHDLLNKTSVGAIFIFALAISFFRPIFGFISPVLDGVEINGTYKNDLKSYLIEHTTERDLVLVHGSGTWLLAASNRRSPTSITYYYPALIDFKGALGRYQNEAVATPPIYIIEGPRSCGLSHTACHGKQKFEMINNLLNDRYEREKELHGYVFWRHREY